MADISPPAGNPAGQAPAGQPASQPAAVATTTGQESGEGLSAAVTKAELDQARKDAARYRKELETVQTELKKRQDSELSEIEKAQKRATELEQQSTSAAQELRQERALRQVEKTARKLNIVDEETAALLIRDRIEFDEKGSPTNVPALLEQLIKDKPFLVTQTPGAASAASTGNPPNPTRGTAGGLTLEQIKGKSPQWVADNWEAVEKALAAGR